MTDRIDQTYENAVASNLLPGVSVIAGNKEGEPDPGVAAWIWRHESAIELF